MNKSVILGMALTVTGVFLLAYQGFRFTSRERVVDLGPLKVDTEKTHDFPIPPLIGWGVTITGVLVLVHALRTTKALES